MGSWPDWGKPYKPGLFIIQPPDHVSAIVDAQRKVYDPVSQNTISAHITLTQPLLNDPTESDWALFVQALSKIQPFEIHYGPIKSFLPYPCIWYDVQPAEQVLEMRSSLHQTGLFNLQEGYIKDFIPHMTITEGRSGPEVTPTLLEKLQNESQPGTFLCKELVLSVPDQNFHFSSQKKLPFR